MALKIYWTSFLKVEKVFLNLARRKNIWLLANKLIEFVCFSESISVVFEVQICDKKVSNIFLLI